MNYAATNKVRGLTLDDVNSSTTKNFVSTVESSVIHYGDVQHSLSGEANNVRAIIEPDNINAPAASVMNRVNLAASNSTFVYDGRPVNNIETSS